jgi:hypothetical protein
LISMSFCMLFPRLWSRPSDPTAMKIHSPQLYPLLLRPQVQPHSLRRAIFRLSQSAATPGVSLALRCSLQSIL